MKHLLDRAYSVMAVGSIIDLNKVNLARALRLLMVLAIVVPMATAADPDPFVGTWHFQMNRSKLNSTYKIVAAGEGKYQTDGGAGLGPVLPVDGSSHDSPLGGSVSLKQIDDHTYVYTLKRQLLYKRTITLDGDHMKWAEDQELDTGKHQVFESEWVRVGHGTGLAGEWRRTAIKDPQADQYTMTIRAIPNGLRTKSSDRNLEQDTYFDGKEHAEADPNDVKGLSYVAKRLDAHSYRQVEKRNGKVLDSGTCKLSDDENTMTCTWVDNRGQETVVVQERVSR